MLIFLIPSGSEDSRRSVLRAALGAARPKDAYSKCGEDTVCQVLYFFSFFPAETI